MLIGGFVTRGANDTTFSSLLLWKKYLARTGIMESRVGGKLIVGKLGQEISIDPVMEHNSLLFPLSDERQDHLECLRDPRTLTGKYLNMDRNQPCCQYVWFHST
ncbi:hypothetical protein IMY05_015G0090400 [Salix suchowensis]|nr:hypothetical protein IMY05_015G0090400 [Salix suchowensis]